MNLLTGSLLADGVLLGCWLSGSQARSTQHEVVPAPSRRHGQSLEHSQAVPKCERASWTLEQAAALVRRAERSGQHFVLVAVAPWLGAAFECQIPLPRCWEHGQGAGRWLQAQQAQGQAGAEGTKNR